MIEYACWLMARAAGIEMSEARLLEENGRRHFMTRRFDRTPVGGKLHMQSLGAMAHFDYNQPGAYGYEQAVQAMRRLGLGLDELEQFYRRVVFNILARNQDDHVKNIAFLMDRQGNWRLSPAFDMVYSYNPDAARGFDLDQFAPDSILHSALDRHRQDKITMAERPQGQSPELAPRYCPHHTASLPLPLPTPPASVCPQFPVVPDSKKETE